MNDLYADIGYKSINHKGEQLCGDHVDIVKQDDNSSVVVLADGLGSGVKASILSTLTSKIISTMVAQGLPLEECVSTIAATLPINSEHGVAYSTFTILHILDNETVDIIEYENPDVIYIRDGEVYELSREELIIEGKTIYSSTVKLQVGDVITAMSDGCPYASPDKNYRLLLCILHDVSKEETQRVKKENISKQTIEIADKVVDKQMRIVQEIASLLGETTAETKIALTKLKESISDE